VASAVRGEVRRKMAADKAVGAGHEHGGLIVHVIVLKAWTGRCESATIVGL
jgi:hypothetical protein